MAARSATIVSPALPWLRLVTHVDGESCGGSSLGRSRSPLPPRCMASMRWPAIAETLRSTSLSRSHGWHSTTPRTG